MCRGEWWIGTFYEARNLKNIIIFSDIPRGFLAEKISEITGIAATYGDC